MLKRALYSRSRLDIDYLSIIETRSVAIHFKLGLLVCSAITSLIRINANSIVYRIIRWNR